MSEGESIPEAPLPPNLAASRNDRCGPGSRHAPIPQVPEHELIHPIGHGSYGEVWLARSVLGTLRAIKIVCQRDFPDPAPFAREFHGIHKFEPVSRAHPALVDVLQVGRNDAEGYYYYVMELADPAGDPKPELREPNEGRTPKSTPAAANLRGSACGVLSDFELRTPDFYQPRTLGHDLRTRGRLPFAECLDLGLALAGALEHLHQHGLIHRDVKPSNVIFVNGQPKLADIGLVAGIDEARSFVGTEGFVPPEGPGTPQADLYSAGKLLYEAAMGRSRLEFPALPADWDAMPPDEQARLLEFNEVLLKACESEPRRRYHDAGELRRDLERLARGGSVRRQHTRERLVRRAQQILAVGIVVLLAGWGAFSLVRDRATTGATTERASVFVLPFRSEGTNAVPGDLCDRITDAMIDALATIQGVRRSPRKSGWVYRDEVELREALVRTNDFRHVLCGRIAQAGEGLTLVWRLFERRRSVPLWEEVFRGTTNGVVDLERRALEKLADRLALTVTAREWAAIGGLFTNNLEALGWFRQATALYDAQGGTQPACNAAMQLCQKALELDRGYLAADYLHLYMWRSLTPERLMVEGWRNTETRVDTILSLDDTIAGAWDHKAGVALVTKTDWAGVDECYARLLEVVPPARRAFYRAWYLRICGRAEEAQREQEKFEATLPICSDEWLIMATSRWVRRQFRDGADVACRALQQYPQHHDLHWILARCLIADGDGTAAIEVIQRGLNLWRSQELLASRACAYAGLGDVAEARKHLGELLGLRGRVPYLQPYLVARVHAALGDKEAALMCLRQAAEDRSEYLFLPDLGGLRTDPAWDDLQKDARYWEICDRVGLGRADWPRQNVLP